MRRDKLKAGRLRRRVLLLRAQAEAAAVERRKWI